MGETQQQTPEEELAEVEEHIQAARRQAQDHGTIPGGHHHPTFADPDADGEPEPRGEGMAPA